MRDHELEEQVKAAFDSIELPQTVKQQTLDRVLDRSSADAHADRSALSSANEKASVIEPSFKRTRRRKTMTILSGALAACLIVAAALFAIPQHETTVEEILEPTAFVDIDINPSIQLKLDQSGTVVDSEGINDDGVEALSKVALEGMSYEQALKTLAESDALAPYFEEDAFVAVSVSSQDQAQEQALIDASEAWLASVPCRSSCSVASQQFYEEAHSHGMGCGRYAAAVELIELDPDTTLEECSRLSMRELHDRIASCASDDATGSNQGQNANNGAHRDFDNGRSHGAGRGHGADHGSYHGQR